MKKSMYTLTLFSFLYTQVSLAKGPQEYYNYELKEGRTIVYRGQTKDPHRRELEHLRDGKEFTHMRIVGGAKTRNGVLKMERESLETHRRGHGGKNPKYNKTDHG